MNEPRMIRTGIPDYLAGMPLQVGYALTHHVVVIAIGAEDGVRFQAVLDVDQLAQAPQAVTDTLRNGCRNVNMGGGTLLVIGYNLPTETRATTVTTLSAALDGIAAGCIEMLVEGDHAAQLTGNQPGTWTRLPEIETSAYLTDVRLRNGVPAATREQAASAWAPQGAVRPTQAPVTVADVEASWIAVLNGEATAAQAGVALMAITSRIFRDHLIETLTPRPLTEPGPSIVPAGITAAAKAHTIAERIEHLRGLVQATDPAHCAPICTITAMVAYSTGDGTRAHMLTEHALRADPGYGLALMLSAMIRNAVPLRD